MPAPPLPAPPRRFAPLVVVGLTGGIASGKTTVSRMFAALGARVLNADDEGRAAVAPGEPALAELAAAFGSRYLRPDGTLDRRALAERVFSARADLACLNRITHPRIACRLEAQLRGLARRPPRSRVVVVEAAVLIEAGWHPLVDRIVVVTAQPSTQTARLMAGLNLTASEAEARIRSQLPLRERLRYADYRVSGEGAVAETQSQVAAVWSHLQRLAGGSARGGG